jgi:hypothetical protein
MNNENIEKIINVADQANKAENSREIFIPVLDDFEVVENKKDESGTILVAVKNNTLEQYITDGFLLPGETLDTRIEKVKENLKNNIPNKELYDNFDNYITYYEDYNNYTFYFKVYAQDILAGTEDKLLCTKQLNGYFINPERNEFCQISVAAGPYVVDNQHKLLQDIDNLEADETIIGLTKALELIMDNITYY